MKSKLSNREVCDLVQHAKWLGRKQMGSRQRVVMKTVKLLCPDYVGVLQERYGPRRVKFVYILDSSGGGSTTADKLIQLGVKIIISKGKMSHLALSQFNTAHIPVIEAGELKITIIDEFGMVDIEQLEQQLTEWQRIHLEKEREAAADALEKLIEKYRQERRQGS